MQKFVLPPGISPVGQPPVGAAALCGKIRPNAWVVEQVARYWSSVQQCR